MPSDPHLFEVDALVSGKYRIVRLLGRGGMGAVFLAENIDIGRKVAIKILHPELSDNVGLLTRFRQEARAAAAIDHPGIVDVFDLGTADDGSAFIVMEYLEGESLGDRIEREGALPIPEVIDIADQLLDALSAAHAADIIHRDLKPDNVILVAPPKGGIKIVDFGISKLRREQGVSLTQTGEVVGTPLYMSPEQVRGAKDAMPSSDLYAIGAILYCALVGHPPFSGDTYGEVLSKVLTEPATPLDQLRNDVPLELSSLVVSLMAKQPAARPANAGQARALLLEAADDIEGLELVGVRRKRTPSGRLVRATRQPPASGGGGGLAHASTENAPQISIDQTEDREPDAAQPDDPHMETAPNLAPHDGTDGVQQPGDLRADAAPPPAASAATNPPPAGPRSRSAWLALAGIAGVGAVVVTFVALGQQGSEKPGAMPAAPSAAAVAAPARDPAQQPAGPASPALDKVRLIAQPDKARWFIDGNALTQCANECLVTRPPRGQDVRAEARATSHSPGDVRVRFDSVGPIRITLEQTTPSRSRGPRRPVREPTRGPGEPVDEKQPPAPPPPPDAAPTREPPTGLDDLVRDNPIPRP